MSLRIKLNVSWLSRASIIAGLKVLSTYKNILELWLLWVIAGYNDKIILITEEMHMEDQCTKHVEHPQQIRQTSEFQPL